MPRKLSPSGDARYEKNIPTKPPTTVSILPFLRGEDGIPLNIIHDGALYMGLPDLELRAKLAKHFNCSLQYQYGEIRMFGPHTGAEKLQAYRFDCYSRLYHQNARPPTFTETYEHVRPLPWRSRHRRRMLLEQ